MTRLDPTPENEAQLYEAVGRALTAWGEVERNLSYVFSYVTNPHNQTAAVYAFWQIHSFEGRLRMTKAAVDGAFINEADCRDAFRPIYNACSRRKSARNDLAHGEVVDFSWENRSNGATYTDMYFLPYASAESVRYAPSLQHMRDTYAEVPELPANRMYIADIQGKARTFKSLANRLFGYRMHIEKRLGS